MPERQPMTPDELLDQLLLLISDPLNEQNTAEQVREAFLQRDASYLNVLTGVLDPQRLKNFLDENFKILAVWLPESLGGGTTVPESVPFANQSTVTITHNLGRLVQVQVYGTTGDSIRGQIMQSSLNALTITFSQPLSGTVVLR